VDTTSLILIEGSVIQIVVRPDRRVKDRPQWRVLHSARHSLSTQTRAVLVKTDDAIWRPSRAVDTTSLILIESVMQIVARPDRRVKDRRQGRVLHSARHGLTSTQPG
jgi:hypothetical protein